MQSTLDNPATQVAHITIEELVRHASTGARKERRFIATGPLTGADEHGEFSGISRDMSFTGAGLLCDRDISGQVSLQVPHVTGNAIIKAMTLWSRPAFGRWWLAGTKFQRNSLVQNFRLWMAGQMGRLRRRVEYRQPFFASLNVLEKNNHGQGIPGCSVNISKNGIGVALPVATKSRLGQIAVQFQDHNVALRATRRWQQQIHSDLFLSGWQFAPVTRALSDLAR